MDEREDLFPQLKKEPHRELHHTHTFLWIGLLIVVTSMVVGGWFLYLQPKFSSDSLIACTLEAKQCPDGSFVGRTGPNCEFTECPDFE